MARILTDNVLNPSYFVECYTGYCFSRCNTYNEVRNCLSSKHIGLGEGFPLTKIEEALKTLPPDAPCVFVQFYKEGDCYMDTEVRLIRIQKKFEKSFFRRLTEDD